MYRERGAQGEESEDFDFFFFKGYKLKLIGKGVKFITTLWNSAIEHNGSKK